MRARRLLVSLLLLSGCGGTPPPDELVAVSQGVPDGAAATLTVVREADPLTVRVDLHVTDTDATVFGTYVDWGDGQVDQMPLPIAACAAPVGPPAPRTAAPLDERVSLTHAYAGSGRYDVSVEVETAVLCGEDGDAEESVRLADVAVVP